MSPRVSVVQHGRDGHVAYHEGANAITGYFEFGGGDVVAIVSMGSDADWRARHGWAIDRRGEILRFVAAELIRQKAPDCQATIDDASGDIVFRLAGAGAADRPPATPAASAGTATGHAAHPAGWVRRFGALQGRLGAIGLAAALLAGAAAWVKTRVLVVAPVSGVPIGPVVRTDTHLASLIDTRQPYTPSLNHNSSTERFTVSLFLVPLDGTAVRLFQLKSDLRVDGYPLARIIGSDGRTLWLDVAGLAGVNLQTYARVTDDDVKAANPGLDARWIDDTRRIDVVDGRLQMLSDDHREARALDPASLRASPVPPKNVARPLSEPPLTLHMAAGLRVSNTSWLGLQSDADLAGAYRPGEWLRAVESATDTPRDTRWLVRGTLDPGPSGSGDHRRITAMTPIGDAAYRNASFLRLNETSAPLRLTSPDSALMLHTSGDGTGTSSTLLVSRVDVANGRLMWTADTGIHRFALAQVLPTERSTVFVGTRPPIPDKVSEPLAVILDHATGELTTHSLWR